MKILGVNISHDTSVCVYENKKITKFLLEERFIVKKNWDILRTEVPNNNNIFLLSVFKEIDFKPDFVVYASFDRRKHVGTQDQKIIDQIQKQLDHPPYYFNKINHHIYHACSAFHFSDFTEAMAIVIDGAGSSPLKVGYSETQSIFYINKNKVIKLFQHLSNLSDLDLPDNYNAFNNEYSNYVTVKFEKGVEYHLSSLCIGGLNFIHVAKEIKMISEYGKVMGLSSYAYTDKKFNLNYEHVEKAKQVQEKTFNETCEIIEKAYDYKKINNFVLSGGYFLNCSNNFKYVKKYPHINFFIDPNPTDGGTAIGACVYYDNYK